MKSKKNIFTANRKKTKKNKLSGGKPEKKILQDLSKAKDIQEMINILNAMNEGDSQPIYLKGKLSTATVSSGYKNRKKDLMRLLKQTSLNNESKYVEQLYSIHNNAEQDGSNTSLGDFKKALEQILKSTKKSGSSIGTSDGTDPDPGHDPAPSPPEEEEPKLPPPTGCPKIINDINQYGDTRDLNSRLKLYNLFVTLGDTLIGGVTVILKKDDYEKSVMNLTKDDDGKVITDDCKNVLKAKIGANIDKKFSDVLEDIPKLNTYGTYFKSYVIAQGLGVAEELKDLLNILVPLKDILTKGLNNDLYNGVITDFIGDKLPNNEENLNKKLTSFNEDNYKNYFKFVIELTNIINNLQTTDIDALINDIITGGTRVFIRMRTNFGKKQNINTSLAKGYKMTDINGKKLKASGQNQCSQPKDKDIKVMEILKTEGKGLITDGNFGDKQYYGIFYKSWPSKPEDYKDSDDGYIHDARESNQNININKVFVNIGNQGSEDIPTLLKSLTVTLFGYGFSGSGKTYTLLGDLGEDVNLNNVNLGLTQAILKGLEDYGDKFSFSAFEIAPSYTGAYKINYTVNSSGMIDETIVTSESEEEPTVTSRKITDINKYIKYITDLRKKSLRISPTTNNPESSRGHLFLEFKILNSNDKPYGTSLIVVDMAGAEDTKSIKQQFFTKEDPHSKETEHYRLKIGTDDIGTIYVQDTYELKESFDIQNRDINSGLYSSSEYNAIINPKTEGKNGLYKEPTANQSLFGNLKLSCNNGYEFIIRRCSTGINIGVKEEVTNHKELHTNFILHKILLSNLMTKKDKNQNSLVLEKKPEVINQIKNATRFDVYKYTPKKKTFEVLNKKEVIPLNEPYKFETFEKIDDDWDTDPFNDVSVETHEILVPFYFLHVYELLDYKRDTSIVDVKGVKYDGLFNHNDVGKFIFYDEILSTNVTYGAEARKEALKLIYANKNNLKKIINESSLKPEHDINKSCEFVFLNPTNKGIKQQYVYYNDTMAGIYGNTSSIVETTDSYINNDTLYSPPHKPQRRLLVNYLSIDDGFNTTRKKNVPKLKDLFFHHQTYDSYVHQFCNYGKFFQNIFKEDSKSVLIKVKKKFLFMGMKEAGIKSNASNDYENKKKILKYATEIWNKFVIYFLYGYPDIRDTTKLESLLGDKDLATLFTDTSGYISRTIFNIKKNYHQYIIGDSEKKYELVELMEKIYACSFLKPRLILENCKSDFFNDDSTNEIITFESSVTENDNFLKCGPDARSLGLITDNKECLQTRKKIENFNTKGGLRHILNVKGFTVDGYKPTKDNEQDYNFFNGYYMNPTNIDVTLGLNQLSDITDLIDKLESDEPDVPATVSAAPPTAPKPDYNTSEDWKQDDYLIIKKLSGAVFTVGEQKKNIDDLSPFIIFVRTNKSKLRKDVTYNILKEKTTILINDDFIINDSAKQQLYNKGKDIWINIGTYNEYKNEEEKEITLVDKQMYEVIGRDKSLPNKKQLNEGYVWIKSTELVGGEGKESVEATDKKGGASASSSKQSVKLHIPDMLFVTDVIDFIQKTGNDGSGIITNRDEGTKEIKENIKYDIIIKKYFKMIYQLIKTLTEKIYSEGSDNEIFGAEIRNHMDLLLTPIGINIGNAEQIWKTDKDTNIESFMKKLTEYGKFDTHYNFFGNNKIGTINRIFYLNALTQYILNYITIIVYQGDGIVTTLDHLKVFFDNKYINPEKDKGPCQAAQDESNSYNRYFNDAIIQNINHYSPQYQKELANKNICPPRKYRLDINHDKIWTSDHIKKEIGEISDSNKLTMLNLSKDSTKGSGKKFIMYQELQDIALKQDKNKQPILNKFFMFANFKGGYIKGNGNDEKILKQAAINTLMFAQSITGNYDRPKCFKLVDTASGGGIKYLNKKPKRRRRRSRKRNKNNTKINKNTSIRRTSIKKNRKKHTKRKK